MEFPRNGQIPSGRILASFVLATLFASCQSTESVTPAEGVKDIGFEISINRAFLFPDSLSWEVGTNSGEAKLGHDSTTENDAFSVSIHLPSAIGTDVLYLLLWRDHMLTSRQGFTVASGSSVSPSGSGGRDTMATTILERLQGLNAAHPKTYPIHQDSSIAKSMAVLLVEGDSLFKNWTAKFPRGVDTARVRREALVYAASLGSPLATIVSGWNLGMTFDEARTAILGLVGRSIPASDTDALFPVPAVRVTEPVSLSGPLYSDSVPVALHGKFIAKKRLFAPSFVVRKGGAEVKNHFEFVQQLSPSGSTTAWDLASNGGVTLRAYGGIEPGAYTLVVWMEDGSFGDSSKIDFLVLSKPDDQGPSLERAWPANDTTLSFADSIVTISVKATDTSGVESVTSNGRILTRTGSVYTIVDTVPATGTWTDIAFVATDMLDNHSTIHIRLLRASPATAKPTATLLEPAAKTGDTIPTSQATRHVVWRITDPVGIVPGTVQINLGPATKIDDSTWSAEVRVPPTGKVAAYQVQALNRNGNGVVDSVMIVRRKDTKPPVVTNLLGSRTVLFDTVSTKLAWKVSDDLKVDSIWINGVPQVVRPDSTYTFTIASLSLDANRVRIKAKDSAGNIATDSQTITRLPNTKPPTLQRVSGTGDMTVGYGTADSIQVRWIASGNEQIDSVAINGKRAKNSRDTFFLNVAVVPGQTSVVARAWNLSGLSTGDSIAISVKLRDKDGNYYGIRTMPDGRIWMTQNIRTLPNQGSSSCAMSNCDLYGATYTWSQAMALDAAYNSTSASYAATSQQQGICPADWHVPTRSEWNALFASTMNPAGTDSSEAIRSDSGWSEWRCLLLARELAAPITEIGPVITPIKLPACRAYNTNGSNKFDAFLRASQGAIATGTWANFWTAQDGATTTAVTEYIAGSTVTAPATTKTTASSVRCIRDQLFRIKIPIIIRGPLILTATN